MALGLLNEATLVHPRPEVHTRVGVVGVELERPTMGVPGDLTGSHAQV